MGSLYTRGQWIWMKYRDHHKMCRSVCSGFKATQRARAESVLEALDHPRGGVCRCPLGRVDAAGGRTVASYSEEWLSGRRTRKIKSSRDEAARLRDYIIPVFGPRALASITRREVKQFVTSLGEHKSVRKGKEDELLAPRTQRAVYEVLRLLLRDAVRDDLIEKTPCTLDRDELPARIDKDPDFRPNAVFTHAEVEQLISDPRVPPDRRVLYAILFMTGMRVGEAAALPFEKYESRLEPLGRIRVSVAYDSAAKTVGGLKTRKKGVQSREVPVHRTLAGILASWKLSGWQIFMGRSPTDADLVVPARTGGYRSAQSVKKALASDLDRLGLRPRRTHDMRRTLISLATDDGADKEMLAWATHPPTDQISQYKTLAWKTRCRPFETLCFEFREVPLVALPRAMASNGDPSLARSHDMPAAPVLTLVQPAPEET